jgi:hypothetical protein
MSGSEDMAKTLIDHLLAANTAACEAIVAYYNLQLAECERKVHFAKTLLESAERTLEDAWGNRPGGPGHHG